MQVGFEVEEIEELPDENASQQCEHKVRSNQIQAVTMQMLKKTKNSESLF